MSALRAIAKCVHMLLADTLVLFLKRMCFPVGCTSCYIVFKSKVFFIRNTFNYYKKLPKGNFTYRNNYIISLKRILIPLKIGCL